MLREASQGASVVAPVLHQLAGQLDRIPLHSADSRCSLFVHTREQMMKTMAELMEQSEHLFVGEQRGSSRGAGREVTGQVRGRVLRVPVASTRRTFIHPSPTSLVVSSVEV